MRSYVNSSGEYSCEFRFMCFLNKRKVIEYMAIPLEKESPTDIPIIKISDLKSIFEFKITYEPKVMT